MNSVRTLLRPTRFAGGAVIPSEAKESSPSNLNLPFLSHCIFAANSNMPSFVDQIGKTIVLDKAPQRIVSLVPSQTELLYDFGLNNKVIGITKFCVHPELWFKTKTRVGGTKQLNFETIHKLKPDLIIANKEENVKEQIEELSRYYPVWTSDVNDLTSAYEMITQVGLLTDTAAGSQEIIDRIKQNFSRLSSPNSVLRTIYLIWKDPYMTVGHDTFIHSMMKAAGFKNAFEELTRYPELPVTELQNRNPELVLLSSEPFPFKQKHIDELQPLLPHAKIILVDGEMFSWYGSRLQHASDYLNKLRAEMLSNAH